MNRILFIILFTYSFSANGLDSIPCKQEKIISQKNIICDSNSISVKDSPNFDTVKLYLNSNENFTVPIDSNTMTKVVMIKEKSEIDFLRYLLPILTLILGILIKELIDMRSNNQKIKKSGERWVVELRSLEEPLKKQIEVLEIFLQEHIKEEFSIPKISIYTSLNGEVFKSLDKNELIKYIEMKNDKSKFPDIVKISNRVHGYTSILTHLHATYKEKFNKYLNETSSYVDSLTKNLQAFNVAYADYGVEIEMEIKSNPMGDKRFKPIADLYAAHIQPHLEDGKFNPFQLKKDFFTPLLTVVSHLRFDPRTKPISISSSEALNSIKGIEMEKKYIGEITTNIIASYRDQLTSLDDIVNKIENSKPPKKWISFFISKKLKNIRN